MRLFRTKTENQALRAINRNRNETKTKRTNLKETCPHRPPPTTHLRHAHLGRQHAFLKLRVGVEHHGKISNRHLLSRRESRMPPFHRRRHVETGKGTFKVSISRQRSSGKQASKRSGKRTGRQPCTVLQYKTLHSTAQHSTAHCVA